MYDLVHAESFMQKLIRKILLANFKFASQVQIDETTKLLKRHEGAAADSVLEYHEISVAGVAKSEEEAKAEQFAALQAKLKMRVGRRSSQALPKPSADASTGGYLNPNLT